jgi:phosphonate transport system substrate-binding protein
MLRWLGALILGLSSLLALAEAEVRVGIEPYFSPQLLISTFEPLATAVGKTLGRPVVLLTAADYRQFVRRVERQEFDIVVIGPHTARLAQQIANYQPQLIGRAKLSGLVLVRRSSPIQRADQFRHATVALPDDLTLTAMLGEEWLQKHGIAGELHYYPFHNAAAMAVQHGDVDIAIVNKTAFSQMPANVREELRVIDETRGLPNMVMLTRGNLDPVLVRQYTEAIMGFVNSAEHGGSFAGRLGFAGGDPIKPGDLDPVEPFAPLLQQRLKAGQ